MRFKCIELFAEEFNIKSAGLCKHCYMAYHIKVLDLNFPPKDLLKF